MKRVCLSLGIVVMSLTQSFANPSDSLKLSKVKVDFSGFFRVDYWYDSRQVVDAIDGMFLLYPKKPDYDYNGVDLNENPGINALVMATRLRTGITMPDIFNAKSSIMIEGDFTGQSTIVNVRLRHAYAKFQWEKTSVLVGLTWHPLFVTEVFPSVVSLNTGAPFQSFNRSPQLTIQRKLIDGLTLSVSAIHQSDSRSSGPLPSPNESSSLYLRTGVLPNLNAHLQYVEGPFTLGGAIDFKSLRPRLYTTSLTDPTLKLTTAERVNSYTEMLYMKYQSGKFVFKAKGMLGQNLTEHLMLGGYVVSSLDSTTGREEYIPTKHLYTFGNITYGKEFQVGLFFGYAKNLGTEKNFVSSKDRIYGRGFDIKYLYRISPSVIYVKDKFQLSLELEYTAASYGDIDNFDKGKVINTDLTGVYRVLLMMQYNF